MTKGRRNDKARNDKKEKSEMKSYISRAVLAAVCGVAIFAGSSRGADINPYRVALVIGDQWDDPMSFVVHHKPAGRGGAYADTLSSDFSSIVILLKNWCIPFDIIRLDQEFMDINRFVGPDGEPKVGCILWDVPASDKLQPQRYEVIRQAVDEYGIGLIALGDRLQQPVIAELLGLKYIGSWQTSDDLVHEGEHFITESLPNPLDDSDNPVSHKRRVHVEVAGAEPIVKQGKYAQVTVRERPGGARCVWIGSDIGRIFSYQSCRTLLRRAITWTIGYSLFKTWENKAIMVMDDPGTAQCAWLEHWHYGTLTEEQIEEHLIKPLKEHNGILIVNVPPGFVNEELKRIEPSFQRVFTDAFGTKQDYVSTKRGLLKGMKEGVFEIQCHGLTHMQPDLWSQPGPWYGADIDKEKAHVGWYREFGDTRRGKEIPAAEAAWRMKTAVKWIEHQFGVTPMSFVQGGDGISLSYENNTYRLAAEVGFGLYCWQQCYLGKDMAIDGADFTGSLDSPVTIPSTPDAHDKGIAEYPEKFLDAFRQNPDKEWMGINEYVAYMHTDVSGGTGRWFTLDLDYDEHYCRYFKSRASQWQFMASDWLAEELGGCRIRVDGKTVVEKADFAKEIKINIEPGLGTHTIGIE